MVDSPTPPVFSSRPHILAPIVGAVLCAFLAGGCTSFSPGFGAAASYSRPGILTQPQQTPARTRAKGDVDFLVGAGFTESPESVLVTGQLDYYLDGNYAIGPLVQFGFSDDDTILAPSLNLKRVFYVEGSAWRPFVQGGIGAVYMDEDLNFGGKDDIGLLLNLGGGVDVYLDDNFTLGSTIMFNAMPGKVLGESWFIAWQILQFQFRF